MSNTLTPESLQSSNSRKGMLPDRRLFRMARELPITITTDVALRPFRVGADEQEWLAVNNAAFAEHGEQGGWDLPTLRGRGARRDLRDRGASRLPRPRAG